MVATSCGGDQTVSTSAERQDISTEVIEGIRAQGQVLAVGSDAFFASADGEVVSLVPLTTAVDSAEITAPLPARATGFVAVGHSRMGGWLAARTCAGELVRGDASEACLVDGRVVAGGLSLFSIDVENGELVPMPAPDPEGLGFNPVLRSQEIFAWGNEVLLPVTDSETSTKFAIVAASEKGWRVVGEVPSDEDWIRFCSTDDGLVVHAVDYPAEITQPIVGDRFLLLDTSEEWRELATDGLTRTEDSYLLRSVCVDGSMFLLDQASEPASGINDTPDPSGTLYRYSPAEGRVELAAEFDSLVTVSDPAVDSVFFLAVHDESGRDQLDGESVEFSGRYLLVGANFDAGDPLTISRPVDRSLREAAPLAATPDGNSVWYSAADAVALERKA